VPSCPFKCQPGGKVQKILRPEIRIRHHRRDNGEREPFMAVTIYHNPRCGISRNVLAMLRERGIEPDIVLYLETPPDRAMLQDLLAKLDIAPRALMRRKEAIYGDLGLDDPAKSDAALIDAMVSHPILIERPIVVTPKGAVLCRPADKVLEVI
jgi:arsenate reductase (glutaredoxin)